MRNAGDLTVRRARQSKSNGMSSVRKPTARRGDQRRGLRPAQIDREPSNARGRFWFHARGLASCPCEAARQHNAVRPTPGGNVLTAARNDLLTRVGPGTPMGDLLRRYWQPIGGASELEKNPVKPIRLMGENLVLYKDGSGTFGLVDRSSCRRPGAACRVLDQVDQWYGDRTGRRVAHRLGDGHERTALLAQDAPWRPGWWRVRRGRSGRPRRTACHEAACSGGVRKPPRRRRRRVLGQGWGPGGRRPSPAHRRASTLNGHAA